MMLEAQTVTSPQKKKLAYMEGNKIVRAKKQMHVATKAMVNNTRVRKGARRVVRIDDRQSVRVARPASSYLCTTRQNKYGGTEGGGEPGRLKTTHAHTGRRDAAANRAVNMAAAAEARRRSRPDQGRATSQARATLNQTLLEDN